MILSLTRSSVNMGDDVDAPHELILKMNGSDNLCELMMKVKECHYLASIGGGNATWVLYLDNTALAVVAQQWNKTKYLTDEAITMDELFNFKKATLSFRYLAQKDPDEVYRSFE